MPKFEFNRGKMRSLESIAYLDAIERGEEPQRPAASIQKPALVSDVDVSAIFEADDATLTGSAVLSPAQKRAATIARKKAEQAAAIAEPLRPQNIDPATGSVVVLGEFIDPETGEVRQAPVAEEGLGTGTPVEEAATLPSGDARVEAEDEVRGGDGA